MRVIPLSKGATKALLELQNAANEGQVYVFVNSKGPYQGLPIKSQNIWRDFQVIRRRANLAKCSIHDLRRSYCTNLSAAVPMHVVQELAGHSDIRTTQKYYLKMRPEFIEQARRSIDSTLESK